MKICFKLIIIVGLFVIISNSVTCASEIYSNDVNVKLLITGFGPFQGITVNPTEQLILYLENHPSAFGKNVKIKAITLPVLYFESWKILDREISAFKPDILLSFGFAPNSSSIRLETVAHNYDSGFNDNNGVKLAGVIVAGAKDFIPSKLPLKKIFEQLNFHNIPVQYSSNAGGYLCNYIFFKEMNHFADDSNVITGFVHVPNWSLYGDKGLLKAITLIVEQITSKYVQ
jgi:pyroglutamyl-peptidase